MMKTTKTLAVNGFVAAIMAMATVAQACQVKTQEATSAPQETAATTHKATDAQRHDDGQASDKAMKEIEAFYINTVLNPDDDATAAIERRCTDKMKRKLAAAYDYEGEGYAVWELRTGAQDGDGDSKVNKIVALGDGWYRVEFTDMGLKGTKKIKAIEKDGQVLLDDYE